MLCQGLQNISFLLCLQKEILSRWEGLRYLYFLKMFEMVERCQNCKGKVGAQKRGSLVKNIYLSLNLQLITEMFGEQRLEIFHEFS